MRPRAAVYYDCRYHGPPVEFDDTPAREEFDLPTDQLKWLYNLGRVGERIDRDLARRMRAVA